MTRNHVLVVVLGCATLLAAIGTIGYFRTKQMEIQKETTIVHEQEETERTEERSQFWQKVVPWGEDEVEQGETTVLNQGE